jgi:hypothetical protein
MLMKEGSTMIRPTNVINGILTVLIFSMVSSASALAGEKIAARIFKHNVKYEQAEVGDVKGHVVAVYELVGIVTNKKHGASFLAGWEYHECGRLDMNTESGVGSGNGYFQYIDRDKDKICGTWKGNMINGIWKGGEFAWFNGTGKFEGIKATGNWFEVTMVPPNQSYMEFEGEMELP